MNKANEIFTKWTEGHPELNQTQLGNLIGTDARTVRRYISGDTIPHGGVMRLLEVFKFDSRPAPGINIERTMIFRHCDK